MTFECLEDGLYVRRGSRGNVYYERPTIKGRRTYRKLKSRTDNEARREMVERKNNQARHSLQLAPDPYALIEEKKKPKAHVTFGQIFEIYRKRSIIFKTTKRNNITALCSIVRRAIPEHVEKSIEEVEQLPIKLLTAELMRDFQAAMLGSAGDDRIKQDTAAITANSYRIQARSLFMPEMMPYYDGLLPETFPAFMAVKKLKEPPKLFKMPSKEILQKIRDEAPTLKESDPNAYRGYILCFGCGLRRNEAAQSRWNWVEDHGGRYVIRVQTTEDFRPKGRQDRLVPMERSVYEELTSLRAPAIPGQTEYIMFGHRSERWELSFKRLGKWMVSLGWDRKKKAHEGRKIFGSMVTEQFGISAAQFLLGHADIKTTAAYYAGQVNLPDVKIFGT